MSSLVLVCFGNPLNTGDDFCPHMRTCEHLHVHRHICVYGNASGTTSTTACGVWLTAENQSVQRRRRQKLSLVLPLHRHHHHHRHHHPRPVLQQQQQQVKGLLLLLLLYLNLHRSSCRTSWSSSSAPRKASCRGVTPPWTSSVLWRAIHRCSAGTTLKWEKKDL